MGVNFYLGNVLTGDLCGGLLDYVGTMHAVRPHCIASK